MGLSVVVFMAVSLSPDCDVMVSREVCMYLIGQGNILVVLFSTLSFSVHDQVVCILVLNKQIFP